MSRVIVDTPALVAEFNRQGGPSLFAKAKAAVDEAKREGERNPAHTHHVVDQLGVGAPALVAGVVAVPITSTSPFWHFQEFGTVVEAPSRPITRGAQSQGLKVLG